MTQEGFQMESMIDTPWGRADSVTVIAPGILSLSTSSHGGIRVSRELWLTMPQAVRETRFSKGGFFEEDCDWAIPRVFFKAEFDAVEPESYEVAVKILRGWHPEMLAVLGVAP